ncbi:hypothetical protein GH714_029845 [Hevea brasiliensis]|uniref:Flavin-containing monooxygenase n=1 Tax=Hevea brasiliensis TaxID=3981 RepID=A0A6A6NKB4_HEVBR|nr:hypothetical protein GH714_029845 [Hevea brasiliensis]
MGFMDFPFVAQEEGETRDPRRFPGHREVLLYLQDFARKFRIEELISGHHTEPRIAEIPGVDLWPGKQIHSHNYRTPEPFRDQMIIIIGHSWSSADISAEIAAVAKEVHIASRSVPDGTYEKQRGYDNMWLHSMIESSHEDGTVVFRDGSAIVADVILHCTGYKYHFPFLKTHGIVTVNDNHVGPLYKHVFPPVLAPWVSFVGIPWKNLLPSQEEMVEDVNTFYSTLEASGIPKRYTHNLFNHQADYNNWLAAQCQCPGFEEWRNQMYHYTTKNSTVRPKTYRDEWEDDHLIIQSHEDFKKYLK